MALRVCPEIQLGRSISSQTHSAITLRSAKKLRLLQRVLTLQDRCITCDTSMPMHHGAPALSVLANVSCVGLLGLLASCRCHRKPVSQTCCMVDARSSEHDPMVVGAKLSPWCARVVSSPISVHCGISYRYIHKRHSLPYCTVLYGILLFYCSTV